MNNALTLKHINELDLSTLPEVDGKHFMTQILYGDREAMLIVGVTPCTVKCIPLYENCVSGDVHGVTGEPVYEFYYNEDDLTDKDGYITFRKSRKYDGLYKSSVYDGVLTSEPHYRFDPEF